MGKKKEVPYPKPKQHIGTGKPGVQPEVDFITTSTHTRMTEKKPAPKGSPQFYGVKKKG